LPPTTSWRKLGITNSNLFLTSDASGVWRRPLSQLSTPAHAAHLPKQFSLEQNYPNPFNPSTEIRYQVSGTSEVRLEVFDMLGRTVATLVNERQAAGSYQVKFNAVNLASGIYFYRLDLRSSGSQAGQFVETRKMMFVK
jgi:hypothetical protein